MSRPKVMPFDEAFEHARDRTGGQALLLGNGFSIACCQSFDYRRLLDVADFGGTARARRIRAAFEQSSTADFEQVVRRLHESAKTLGIYEPNSPSRGVMRRDARAVRASLAAAIARVHPERIDSVGDGRLDNAHDFLRGFDSVFTLSYDLLLYWAILRRDRAHFKDGFGRVGNDLVHLGPVDQNVSYLHGAMHLSEDFVLGEEPRTIKAAWDGRTPLVDRLHSDLDQGLFPLIVMEGDSTQKQRTINASPYLSDAQERLRSLEGSLFTFGWSFAEGDDHVIAAVMRSGVRRLYVGLHGEPGEGANPLLVGRALAVQAAESSIRVRFWDTATASVW